MRSNYGFVRAAVLALIAVVGTLGLTAPAQAQATGNVAVDIDLPALVILYYYSDVDVTIPTSALAGVMVGGTGDTASDQGTLAATLDGNFENDAALAAPALNADPTAVPIYLIRSWAVRSVGPASGADTQVSVALTGSTLTDAVNGGDIEINSVAVRTFGTAGAGSSAVTFAPTGLTSAQLGDVVLDVDLTNADFEGTYSGGTFTITAENL